MADLLNRYPDNAAGRYYVDDQCFDCDFCRETAPEIFGRNKAGRYSFVARQPKNALELALCEEVVEGCPYEAVGNNGA